MQNKPVKITRKTDNRIVPVETGDEVYVSEQDLDLIESFAAVLEYPGADRDEQLRKSASLCFQSPDPISVHFVGFTDTAAELTLDESKELYTRTFDLNPVCALEIGYHLFGEDYKRGAFLANLRETENPYELGQENQLPDYLPVVLRLLRKMENAELRASLIGCCLLPSLQKMNTQLKKKKSPYEGVFTCLEMVLNRIAKDSVSAKAEPAEARYQHV